MPATSASPFARSLLPVAILMLAALTRFAWGDTTEAPFSYPTWLVSQAERAGLTSDVADARLAALLAERGDWLAARNELRRLVFSAPAETNAPGWLSLALGFAAYRSGSPVVALENFRSVSGRGQKPEERCVASFWVGLCHARLGNLDIARQVWQSLDAESSPAHAKPYLYTALRYAGACLASQDPETPQAPAPPLPPPLHQALRAIEEARQTPQRRPVSPLTAQRLSYVLPGAGLALAGETELAAISAATNLAFAATIYKTVAQGQYLLTYIIASAGWGRYYHGGAKMAADLVANRSEQSQAKARAALEERVLPALETFWVQ